MERITMKMEGEKYCAVPEIMIDNIINKCGEAEDLLEKYGIANFTELENKLKDYEKYYKKHKKLSEMLDIIKQLEERWEKLKTEIEEKKPKSEFKDIQISAIWIWSALEDIIKKLESAESIIKE
ncbi:MAG: hypothetical protein J6J36_07020 [Clostridia bacterium]|nr:hypothetical protein [Clostridia bacterium]